MSATGQTPAIIDLFAGPGGWDEGLRLLDRHEDALGVEWDAAACETARAAGHARLQADLAELDPRDFGPIEGLIASPPCQAYSSAGKGLGRQDRPVVEECIRELAEGIDLRWQHAGACLDPRALLTAEPMRWAATLRPRWIACEQVPAVLPLWELMAELLGELGYSCDAGFLSAEQFGVPQTRKRAYLVASLDGPAKLPAPTHTRYSKGKPRHEFGLLPWVSMAEALGWGMTERPYALATAGGSRGGADEQVGGSGARRGLYGERERGAWVPPTWTFERPATTIACDARVFPGPRSERNPDYTPGGPPQSQGHPKASTVRLTPGEASRLMGFPAGYPWQGRPTKQFQQIGNAVCPPVGAAVLAAAIGAQAVELAEAA